MSLSGGFVPAGTSASGIVADHLSSVPVDLRKMAGALGLHVEFNRTLPAGVSGKIYRSGQAKNGYCIEVNATEPETRQRFTLAHEIAHYVLHRDLIGDGVSDDALYRSTLSTKFETQANRLAADILIPARILEAEYRLDRSVPRLARRFQVSEKAIEIRLRQVGLTA